MRTCARRVVVAVVALAGCVAPPSFPPPPDGVLRIAVAQPANRTGDELVVDGPGLLQRLFKRDVVTVPDLLAEDLRTGLTRQGFRVVEPGADAPLLRTDILRWQPYAADYESVTVDLTVSLVEQEGGRELWKATRSDWVVPTISAGSRHEAMIAASAAIADALLEGWHPAAGTP
jgi:hypothetical protein